MKVLRNGKLVTVKSLKSDSMKKVAPKNVVTPEKAAPTITEPTTPLEPNETPSIHEEKTVPQLKAFLTENNVEYPKTAKKADLVDLADTVELDGSDEI